MCVGGEAGVGGRAHSWIEPLTSNSPTTECCVSHTPRSPRVSNQVCEKEFGEEGVRKKKAPLVSLSSPSSQSLAAMLDKHLSGSLSPPPYSHIPFHPLTHTHPLSLCLPHSFPHPPPPPHLLSFLFFSFHYIFASLSWESAPPHRWKEAGLRRVVEGWGHFFFFFNSESKLKQRTGERPSDRLNAGRRGLERMTIELWRERSQALLI